MTKTVAFMPVRAGSKAIPHQNIKKLHGRPLFYWALDAAVNCPLIDEVFVSTDSFQIGQMAKAYNHPKIKLVGRSEESAADWVHCEAAMLEFAEGTAFDNIVLLHATSPLLESQHLLQGLALLAKGNDSVVSVTRRRNFMWAQTDAGAKPTNYDPAARPKMKDFDGYCVENDAFTMTTRAAPLASKCRVSGTVAMAEMGGKSGYKIDEPADWVVAEQLLKRRDLMSRNTAFKFADIKAVFSGSDGVLTDGGMYYSESGDQIKKFCTRDDIGFQLLKKAGMITGIITGQDSSLLAQRAQTIDVDELHMGVSGVTGKLAVIEEMMGKYNLRLEEIAYIGDDINDIEVIQKVGFGCCVADGMEEVKQFADYVTKVEGGKGAVREVVEYIFMKSKL